MSKADPIDLKELKCKLYTLSVFRNLLRDEVIMRFMLLLESLDKERSAIFNALGEFADALYQHGDSFSDFVLSRMLYDDNPYIRACAREQEISAIMRERVGTEIGIISEMAHITHMDFSLYTGGAADDYVPKWRSCPCDFYAAYAIQAENGPRLGYGIFARYHVFKADDTGFLRAVENPDWLSEQEFFGYGRERRAIFDNTVAFLAGKPASNVLLYGDAGTGKSATVKAQALKYGADGLRLIQVSKSQMYLIPQLYEQLRPNPLKFIIFIDDLTFSSVDNDFSALKANLQGGVSAADNVLIYATSNRRHFIREEFSSRDGDEIHRNDTIEETVSLARRFGMIIMFLKPDKELYLSIARHLAQLRGIAYANLDVLAEQYALRNGGRSPRTASQFVDSLISGKNDRA